MKMRVMQKVLAFVFILCLAAGTATVGVAQDVNVADYQAMLPVLDLIANSAICASDFPTVISDAESTLDENFITFFFTNGVTADSSLGITDGSADRCNRSRRKS